MPDGHLDELRRRIDAIDRRLIRALAERRQVVREVAAWKAATGTDVMQPARVTEVLDTRSRWGAEQGLDPAYVRRLYQLLIDQACAEEEADGS